MRRRAFEPALHRIGASQRARLVVPDVVRRALGSRPRVPRDDVSAVGARIAAAGKDGGDPAAEPNETDEAR
ncbi:hypothetical protein, partial [Burkholderia pseudomallei]